MIEELEAIMLRLDEMSEDDFFTVREKVLLEDAARRVDVAFQTAADRI